jgi:5,5'-dehydrodivanillate O-demethylase oxygenase subunit
VGNSARTFQYQIRVPMDDTHTLHLWYTAFIPPEGVAPEPVLMNAVHRFDVPLHDANGEYLLDITDAQDLMVWSVQGEIADRTGEHLGSTDRGLTAFRRMLLREIRRVEEGADPLGVVRGSGERVLTLPLERQKGHHAEGFASVFLRRHWRYAPVADALIALFAERASDPR